MPDQRWGTVRVTGYFRPARQRDEAVVVVHGLGGSSESHYMPRAAAALAAHDYGYLLLEMRGSDLRGEDIYHAGLTADLEAALASDELAPYRRIHLLGYSLGGHVALRYASQSPAARVASVTAVCSPLDLAAAQQAFDRPGRWLYRQYILTRLRRIYRSVAERRELETPLAEVLAAKTIREWDRLTVVPRFGFESPEDYYRQMSVASRLHALTIPSLLVASDRDPMVPPEALDSVLEGELGRLEVRRVPTGGHVAFPEDLDLGFGGRRGLEGQILRWIEEGTA